MADETAAFPKVFLLILGVGIVVAGDGVAIAADDSVNQAAMDAMAAQLSRFGYAKAGTIRTGFITEPDGHR